MHTTWRFLLCHIKEVWRCIVQNWCDRSQNQGSRLLTCSALSSLVGSFLFMVFNGCWSSSLHICIPDSRKGKRFVLPTVLRGTSLISHWSGIAHYMGMKARIWSLLTGYTTLWLLLQERGERTLNIQSHLTATATQIFALMPSLFFPIQNLLK